MGYIYLIKDEKRNECLFKVGYTNDIHSRIGGGYAVHNPLAELVCVCETYGKTKHLRETIARNEMENAGLTRINNGEWFSISYESPLYADLNMNGFESAVFGSCKNKKVLFA